MDKYKDLTFLSSLLLFYILIILPAYGESNDTLSPSQQLSVGQTLTSVGQIFELGFFSPANSTELYVGIWYKIVPERKIVWVANRENALLANDSASRLIIGSNGNLQLMDGKQRTVWSTDAPVQSNGTVAVLTDRGEFILQDNSSGVILWESFNYPSDTLVATMTVGFNTKTGQKSILTSWQNGSDPAPGKFVAGISNDKPPQAFTWINGTKPYWRGGPWDGWKFIGIPDTGKGYENGINLAPENKMGSVYLTFNTFDQSYVTTMVIEPSGMLKLQSWEEGKNQWEVTWAKPEHPCDVYGTCGLFGVCSKRSSPICKCLKGFFPLSNEEWSKGNWTRGCVRQTELMCKRNSSSISLASKSDGFLQLSGMKLPDHYLYLFNEDDQGCKNWCLSNCSCVAYAYPAGIGCMVWVTDLVDIEQFSFDGEDLYLRLDNSEIGVKNGHRKLIISLATASSITLLGVLLCCVLRWKSSKRDTHLKDQNKLEKRIMCIFKGFFYAKNNHTPRDTSRKDTWEELHASAEESSELPMEDFTKIKMATNNFSAANKLGEGGFGKVYKGKLEDGQQIAVKRLSSHSGQGLEEFKNEVILISKLQHRNLVRLLGCCIQGEEKIVILEYMKNKSLDNFLFDGTKKLQLDWAKRFNIIQGIARGLLYLHRDSFLRIIHRDLKASNILLDEDMNPKISDFGLARTFRVTQELANTRKVVGTFGYMSPEYAMGGLFSEKSDVYSFGVLLLEIVSGMKNTGFGYHEKYLNLLGYAWQSWNECKATDLIDQSLVNSCTASEVMRCIHVGLLCVQDHAADRPTMSNVALMLSSTDSELDLPQPRQPTFTFQSLLESDFRSRVPICNNGSINGVTVSMVEGR